jgi:hypothetical protein
VSSPRNANAHGWIEACSRYRAEHENEHGKDRARRYRVAEERKRGFPPDRFAARLARFEPRQMIGTDASLNWEMGNALLFPYCFRAGCRCAIPRDCRDCQREHLLAAIHESLSIPHNGWRWRRAKVKLLFALPTIWEVTKR